jgi:hypothetical protein
MSTITKAKNFQPSDVTYKKPTTNKRGGKSVQLQLHGEPLVLQIPLMLTWGINERVGEDSGRVSYDMALQFQPDKHSSIAKFLDAMKGLEQKVKDDAVSNSKEWFGKSSMSKEVVDVLMYPILKYPKKKDDSGEPDHDRDPTLKLKIPYWDKKFSIELYDMESKCIYQTVKEGEDGPQGIKNPVDLVPKASHVSGLIGCTGLWFAGGKWGVTWKLIQAKVRPPQRLIGSGKCNMADDSDDEEMQEQLNNETKEEDEVVAPTPAFEDDDEDEQETTSEEVIEESVSEPVKKKKKIVRRKKKTSE